MASHESARAFIDGVRAYRIWTTLAWQTLKSRFRRSVFGILWLFAGFLVFSVATGVVWSQIMNQDPLFLIPFIGIGFACWAFIYGCLVEGGASLIGAAGYIQQLRIPYTVFFMRNVAVQAFTAMAGILMALVVLFVMGGEVTWHALFAIPGLLILFVAGFGATTILGYLGSRFRDTNHALAALMNLLFVVTPVIYPASLILERGGPIALIAVRLNPLFAFIDIVRTPIVYGAPASFESYAMALGSTAFLLIAAFIIHRQMARLAIYYV